MVCNTLGGKDNQGSGVLLLHGVHTCMAGREPRPGSARMLPSITDTTRLECATHPTSETRCKGRTQAWGPSLSEMKDYDNKMGEKTSTQTDFLSF